MPALTRKLPGLELGKFYSKHILLCEKNLYAAILLEHFRLHSYSADCSSIGMDDDYHDPAIYNSLAGIAEWFMGTIEPVEMIKAFDLLVSKEYILYRYIHNNKSTPRYQRVMSIVCDYEKVDADSEILPWPKSFIHVPEHRVSKEETNIPTVKQISKMPIPEECEDPDDKKVLNETRKVRYHNSRAKKANLPATLTLDQWAEALEYFQWKCAYCQKNEYTILEHYIPLGHGKGTTVDNCVPACGSCNNIKQSWNPNATYGPDMERMKEGFARVQAYLATKAE